MLLRRWATTRPGLIGPVAPGGSAVDPAVPGAPRLAPILPVQPNAATAIAAAKVMIDRAARSDLHEGKGESGSTSSGIGRRFLSNEYDASASSVVRPGLHTRKKVISAARDFAGSPDPLAAPRCRGDGHFLRL